MSHEISYSKCIEFFEYFYSKIAGLPAFEFTPKKREKVCIESFIKKVEDWDLHFLFTYLCYSFQKYEGLDTNRGKNNIQSMWVFGQKTLAEFRDRDHDLSAWRIDQLKKNYRIKKSDLIQILCDKISLDQISRQERQRFKYDLDRQLIHCLENELYSSEVSECLLCKNKKLCQKTQKSV